MGCAASVVDSSNQVGDLQTAKRRRRLGRQKKAENSDSWSQPVILTDTQKKLVARTMYNRRCKMSDMGVRIFKRIFIMRPDLKQWFQFKDEPDGDLEYNIEFRTHAARFMSVIACAINAIDSNDNQMEQVFHDVGAKHIDIRGFQHGNFNLFKEAVLSSMEEDRFKGDLYRAWDAMVTYIIQRLEAGYTDEMAKRQMPLIQEHREDEPGNRDSQEQAAPLPEEITVNGALES